MMYGHVEESADWVRTFFFARRFQKRTGGFTDSFRLASSENTRLYRHGGARPAPSEKKHLRVHALARVLLHGAIKNLQVSWVKLGSNVARLLAGGRNDFSGTLMEKAFRKPPARRSASSSHRKNRAKIRSSGAYRPSDDTTKFDAC